jgi:hypothetical protein
MGLVQIGGDWEYLFGGDSSGNIFLFSWPEGGENSDTVGGSTTSISAYAETAWIHLPRAAGIENWERMRSEAVWAKIYAGGQPAGANSTISITTNLYTDFSMTIRRTYTTTHSAAAYPAITPVQPKIIKSFGGDLGTFEWIKLRFSNNLAGEHFKIHKIIFGFRPRPDVEE